MADTNWPNPERPGVPMFPEYCGEHILKEKLTGKEIPAFWDAGRPRSPGWDIVALNNQTPESVSKYFSYVRCEHVRIIPTLLTELLAGEREKCLAACESAKVAVDGWGDPIEDGDADRNEGIDDAMAKIRSLGDAP